MFLAYTSNIWHNLYWRGPSLSIANTFAHNWVEVHFHFNIIAELGKGSKTIFTESVTFSGVIIKKNIHSVQTIISSLALKKKLNPTQCSWTISIAFQQNCYGPVRRGSTALSYLSVSIMRLDNRIWSTVHHPILLPVLWCRYWARQWKIPPNRCLDMVINKKGWANGNVGTAEYYAKYSQICQTLNFF